MNTNVYVNTYTHSVAYVTDKMLYSLKWIIFWSGLKSTKLTDQWETLERGIKVWLQGRHLEKLMLEVYNPSNSRLVGRWDFEIEYGYGSDEDGSMWLDTDSIRTAVAKAGLHPSNCRYDIIVKHKPGSPSVSGWTTTTLRSTDGFSRFSIGTSIGANPLGAGVAYWRRN